MRVQCIGCLRPVPSLPDGLRRASLPFARHLTSFSRCAYVLLFSFHGSRLASSCRHSRLGMRVGVDGLLPRHGLRPCPPAPNGGAGRTSVGYLNGGPRSGADARDHDPVRTSHKLGKPSGWRKETSEHKKRLSPCRGERRNVGPGGLEPPTHGLRVRCSTS